MEEDREGKSPFDHEHDVSVFGLIGSIQKIAASNARSQLNSETNVALFLKSWWSDYYNRPMKDPLLESYTLEELLYEFYDKIERKLAREELKQKQEDEKEDKKLQESIDWAEKMEREELEAEAAKDAAKASKAPKATASAPNKNPAEDPDNIKWMQEQIEKAKAQYGQSFGEDIDESF